MVPGRPDRGKLDPAARPAYPVGVVLALLGLLSMQEASLPRTLESAACARPPSIDGAIGKDEWCAAREFDLGLLGVNPSASEERRCRLYVMNSANALYVALDLPDATVNATFSPLDMDAAVLAFARGAKLVRGDDRKAIAVGIHIDKHVTDPGQDADDAKQHGRGALVHRDGRAVYEWAVPLDSGDEQDLRAKAGDALRFNIGVFDAFRPELKDTLFGGIYGASLDEATAWGELKLARDVADDGGAAFRGPAWIEGLLKPAPRLTLTDSGLVSGSTAGRASVGFTYRDARGKEVAATGRILFPRSEGRLPLFFAAGYELDENSARPYLERGWAVATNTAFSENPLSRTVNPDAALLHALRALPCIDDARVVIGGGSAGGWATLMLAAETFPLAGAAPDVPPVNLGYNCAYFQKQKFEGTPPILDAVRPIAVAGAKVYGDDYDGAAWFRQSPLAHLSTITGPVSVVWSTADVLVPIDQVGTAWLRPAGAGVFPERFTMDPAKLMKGPEGKLRLTDLLPAGDFEVFVLPVPDGAGRGEAPPKTVSLPVGVRRWSVAIVDEGAPDMAVGHTKYSLRWDREAFFKRAMEGRIDAGQLTAAKLERLMDRYAGREWLDDSIRHLDTPEAERADVLRGLRTYVAAGHGAVLRELYAKLPAERRVLDPDFFR